MPEIAKVRYTHDAVIDEILMNPSISQNDLAKHFGYTPGWMSIVINSDAFQERLAERKGELTDPKVRASINERLDALAKRSLEKLLDRLDNPGAQIKTLELVAIAKLGVGDKNTRPAGPQTQNNLYVVSLPSPAQDAKSWIANRSDPRGVSDAVEVQPRG